MKDFNIVIAHRGDALGLWATIHSCEMELENSGFNYSYLICANGESFNKRELNKGQVLNVDTERTLTFLHKAGKLGFVNVLQRAVAPPMARQLAAERADGKYLFFLDNHCLVSKTYFARALQNFEKYGMDMLHSATKFFAGDITTFHYNLKLASNFWGVSAVVADDPKPYPIAVAGHGGFAIKTAVWKEVGGYWDGFIGYGGEETYFDLKMALLGKTNYLDPRFVHYHYAGTRPYTRHYTDDYYRNMMMAARIIGGDSWLYKVYNNFANNMVKMKSPLSMYDLLMQAEELSREHAAWIASRRLRTLDEQLALFREQQISC